MPGRRRWFATLLLVLVCAAPAVGRTATLADSTDLQSWRLANGLEVRTRDIPRAGGVAITLGFRAGSGYDPASREG